MSAQGVQAQASTQNGGAVLRSFIRGTLAKKPEFATTLGGAEVCRLVVTGEAAGPASKPPRVTLYIGNGEGSPGALLADEPRRCARGLRVGDVIQAVGNIGPERSRAAHQEVLVTKPVLLRARAADTA
jgi:hypothetical protein